MLEVVADDTPERQPDRGMSVLLARRHRYTGTVSFFRCWSPAPVPLAKLVQVVCCRWRIEEDFQTAKSTTGLDKGQVTTWISWHRPRLFSWECGLTAQQQMGAPGLR
ncbi:hypothetical protein [Streptacidiphilus rugosus]|uniref:hypothetical protein n=1 Tax=Streptacidiphilus rugosus TaxID=405783 RepID=UPI00068A5B84|nr:hypothetical protein [Streptacidiphilus rugosus]